MKKIKNIIVWTIIIVLLIWNVIFVILMAQKKGWFNKLYQSQDTLLCEHKINHSACPFCVPELLEKLGFCNEHGVPEALCTRCNSKLIPAFKVSGDWCAGHSIPESQCFICNPHLLPRESMEHNEKNSVMVIKNADEYIPKSQREPSVICDREKLQIRFAHSKIEENIGLQTEVIHKKKLSYTVESNAILMYNPNKYAHISSIVPGTIYKINKNLGDMVREGEILVLIKSLEFGAAKATFLKHLALHQLAQKNMEREKTLFERKISSEAEFLNAQTKWQEQKIALTESQQKLLLFGIKNSAIKEIVKNRDTTTVYAIKAPFAATITERDCAVGEFIDEKKSLFTLSNLNTMWAVLNIYEENIRHIALKQNVILKMDGLKNDTFAGKIIWIDSAMDERTRTLKVYAQIDNNGGVLKANMFGNAIISIAENSEHLLISKEAVQWDGCCNMAFIKKSSILYQPQKIWLGKQIQDYYIIEKGLKLGDVVASQGSFFLKTEILKDSIGAGCCEAETVALRK